MNITLNHLTKIPLLPYRYRMISIFIICILFFVAIYTFQLSGKIENYRIAVDEEQFLKEQFTHAIKKQITLETIQSNKKKLSEQHYQWSDKIVDSHSLLDLINEILKMAANNNLVLNIFDPGEQTHDGNYDKVPIIVKASGTFHGIANFISQIANSPKIVVINNFTINSTTDTSAKSVLNADINLVLYVKPEAKNDT